MAKRIGVITPGGDSSGINACIRAVVREASFYGFNVYGIYRGYQGLIEGDIKQLTARSVSNIIQHGGTMLHSSRCQIIKTADGIKKAQRMLSCHGISHLVIIGGDGSLNAGLKLSKLGVSVIGIPASIDNDIYGTDETIGFDTAIDVAVEAIDKIRDTARSFERIFIVEVMGREHGYLALEVGLASGAEYIILPEIPYDAAGIGRELKKAKHKGKNSAIIVMAEGAGRVIEVAKQIERITGIQTRASILGYIQRGGSPSARSRKLGTFFGAYAVYLIRKGLRNKLVVLKKGKVSSLSLASIRRKKKISTLIYELAKRVSIVFVVAVFLASALAGCASMPEAWKGFLGISTKILEEGRKDALTKVFDRGYADCYSYIESILKEKSNIISIYAKNKDMIAFYYISTNDTPVGAFFIAEDASHTRVEISSPSRNAKERVAELLFSEQPQAKAK